MTLRRAIIGLLLLALGAVLAAGVADHRCPSWAAPLIWLTALLIAFVFERQRYEPKVAPAGGNWTLTGERFTDPVSGEGFAVFVNPATGERDYRPL